MQKCLITKRYTGAKDIKAKDWYKVTLGSGYKAFFKFIQRYPGVEASGTGSGLRVFVLGMDIEKRVLKHGEEIEIANTTQKDDEFYFYIESRDDTSAKTSERLFAPNFEELSITDIEYCICDEAVEEAGNIRNLISFNLDEESKNEKETTLA